MKPTKKIEKKKINPDYNFPSLLDGNGFDDPLANIANLTDPPVEVVDREVSDLLKWLKEDRKNRLERFRDQLSPNFYVVLCFQSEKQKDEFIEQAEWKSFPGSLYYDGIEIANKLEIRLTPIKIERKIGGKITKKASKMEVIGDA